LETLRGRDHLGELGLGERLMSIWMLNKEDLRVSIRFVYFSVWIIDALFYQGNETSGFIRGKGEFIGQLSY
jgi:hypothetical protein